MQSPQVTFKESCSVAEAETTDEYGYIHIDNLSQTDFLPEEHYTLQFREMDVYNAVTRLQVRQMEDYNELMATFRALIEDDRLSRPQYYAALQQIYDRALKIAKKTVPAERKDQTPLHRKVKRSSI
jgi:hypothetical protein